MHNAGTIADLTCGPPPWHARKAISPRAIFSHEEIVVQYGGVAGIIERSSSFWLEHCLKELCTINLLFTLLQLPLSEVGNAVRAFYFSTAWYSLTFWQRNRHLGLGRLRRASHAKVWCCLARLWAPGGARARVGRFPASKIVCLVPETQHCYSCVCELAFIRLPSYLDYSKSLLR